MPGPGRDINQGNQEDQNDRYVYDVSCDFDPGHAGAADSGRGSQRIRAQEMGMGGYEKRFLRRIPGLGKRDGILRLLCRIFQPK